MSKEGVTTEIERKWLIKDIYHKEIDEYIQDKNYESDVTQSYLEVNDRLEVRLVKYHYLVDGKEEYKLTIKSKDLLKRTEVEKSLTKEQYEALLPMSIGTCHKYFLEYGDFVVFKVIMSGKPNLYYIEKEYESENIAKADKPYYLCGVEVTQNKDFKMSSWVTSKDSVSKSEIKRLYSTN